MLFNILFLVSVPLEFIFVPWYLKALWPVKNAKSLRLKMVCAGLYVLMSVCAIQISGSFTGYAMLMLCGALSGFLGDYFLHAKGTTKYFVLGLTSFLAGHVFYLTAFIRRLSEFAGYKMINAYELTAFAVIMAAYILIAVKVKMRFKPKALLGACALYAVILIWMFIKACVLAIGLAGTGVRYGAVAGVLLIFGSLNFLLSDASLCVILFAGYKGSYPLKIFNIVTYFAAQAALAATIIVV